MSNLYFIRNVGCDDETIGLAQIPDEIFNWFKTTIENLNKNSTYGCMPTIEVYRIDESFIRPATDDDYLDHVMYTSNGKYVITAEVWKYDSDWNRVMTPGVEQVI